MSDYTMFTDDLRDYIRSTSKRRGTDGTQKMVDDFGRWLDEVKAEAWDEGHESAALRIPEGVWHDVAAPHPGNPYRQEQTNE